MGQTCSELKKATVQVYHLVGLGGMQLKAIYSRWPRVKVLLSEQRNKQ